MSRRASAREKLGQLRSQPESVRNTYLNRLNEEQRSYLGYRRGAPRKKQDQDMLLSLYLDFLRLDVGFEDFTDEEMKERGFPTNDFLLLFDRLRSFLIFYIETAKPRSVNDIFITYERAAHARQTMIFWTNYLFNLWNVVPPRPNVLFCKLNEVLEGAAKHRKLTVATTSRSHIGVPELALLIDHDLTATPCIELAECHQLAWCIGRFTAVRPGSLGGQPKSSLEDPDNDESYLMWRDIELSRADERGTFMAKVTIRNLKTNRFDASALPEHKTLTFKLLSPSKASNIQFSVPHRLLTIALRRGALVGIETIDDLFDGTSQNIRIMPEFRDKPVLVAGISRGMDVDINKPLSSKAISAYLKVRAEKVGFPEGVTFYSIRRRFATDIAQVFGNDAARELMGHDPKSYTLERYYLEFGCMKNLVAVGLGESEDTQKDLLIVQKHPQFINRLTPKQIADAQGPALTEMVQESLQRDAEFLALEDANEIRLYKRRARRGVSQLLWKTVSGQATEQMSIETAKTRKDELFAAASSFSERILNLMRDPRFLTDAAATEDDSVDAETLTEDLPRSPSEYDFQPDADTLLDMPNELRAKYLTPSIDESEPTDSEDDTVRWIETQDSATYAQVANMFMQTLMFSSLSTYKPHETVICPLCREDPTESEERKNRERTPWSQRSHLKDKCHSAFERFRRTAKLDADNSDGRYHCPYCRLALQAKTKQIADGKDGGNQKDNAPSNFKDELDLHFDNSTSHRNSQRAEEAEEVDAPDSDMEIDEGFSPKSFHRIDYLFTHIRGSNRLHISGPGKWKKDDEAIRVHDEAKRNAGWYDDDWEGDTVELKRRRQVDISRLARMAGVQFRKDVALVNGFPHESQEFMRRGGPSVVALPQRWTSLASFDPSALFESIPERWRHDLTLSTSPNPPASFNTKPDYFKHMLVDGASLEASRKSRNE